MEEETEMHRKTKIVVEIIQLMLRMVDYKYYINI